MKSKVNCDILTLMAKKTKKEKIIADFRRRISSEKINIEHPKSTVISEAKKSQIDTLYIYPVQLIRKDLTKTLLLSILSISLEVALYFVLERHLVLPFRIKF